MKLIEAMKQVKDLLVKADDLRKKINGHSAHLSLETPVYKDQRAQVEAWLQAHEDITQKIAELQVSIARTNLTTSVTIAIGEKQVTKTITEWIVRRGNGKNKQGTALLDYAAWQQVSDRGLREGSVPSSQGNEPTKVTIVRCYNPELRDKKLELYRSEPSLIDGALEVANAITDLVEK